MTTLAQQRVTAVMAYSEGVFDDCNKALLAALGSGRCQTTAEVLTEYATRYLHATADTAPAWDRWLEQWGVPFSIDTQAARTQLASLLPAGPSHDWRLRQWQLKLELLDLHRQIGAGSEWDAQRLALADQFWRTQEQLQRGVWGLGPVRHVLNVQFAPLPWYASWKQQQQDH